MLRYWGKTGIKEGTEGGRKEGKRRKEGEKEGKGGKEGSGGGRKRGREAGRDG